MVEITILNICILSSARIFDVAHSGEGKFAISLAEWLANMGHDVTLMGSSFAGVSTKRLSKFSDAISKNQIGDKKVRGKQVERKIRVLYPPYSIYLVSRLIITALWFMKIILVNQKLPIDLIHSQDTGYSGLAAVISGKILRIPVIVSSHGIRQVTLTSVIRGRLKKILLKIEHHIDIFVIKNADAILVVNPSIKQYFKQMIVSAKRIEVIPIPIRLRDFEFSEINRDEVRKDIGIKKGDKHTRVIGFIGRFSPEKNLGTLLVSFANIAQDDSYIKLVLVGTGNVEHELREYVKERAIEDKVIFSGVRYDIGRVLAGFDIFVLPSYTEGLSTALLEAMASGRAIVCSDIPANHALVTHNQEALLVNPNKSAELEQAIRLLSKSESLQLKLGQNAKMRASQYDEEIVFPKILQYYKTIISTP